MFCIAVACTYSYAASASSCVKLVVAAGCNIQENLDKLPEILEFTHCMEAPDQASQDAGAYFSGDLVLLSPGEAGVTLPIPSDPRKATPAHHRWFEQQKYLQQFLW